MEALKVAEEPAAARRLRELRQRLGEIGAVRIGVAIAETQEEMIAAIAYDGKLRVQDIDFDEREPPRQQIGNRDAEHALAERPDRGPALPCDADAVDMQIENRPETPPRHSGVGDLDGEPQTGAIEFLLQIGPNESRLDRRGR